MVPHDGNLISDIAGLLEADRIGSDNARIDVRARAQPVADVRVRLGHPDHAARAARVLAQHPSVASARQRGTSVSLRLADTYVADLARRLAAGDPAGLAVSAVAKGRHYLVGFVGPNTSKALHVGHLRNIAVGHALASLLAAAGASVVTESLVSDIGRQVAEGWAGVLALYGGRLPASPCEKPDHLVGRGYAEYVARAGAARRVALHDPVPGEATPLGDAADLLLARWMEGDPEVRAMWARLREWVMNGHRTTLARLGVVIEREDFESDTLDAARAFLTRGLALGALERDGGAVIYNTGRPELARLVLQRADGLPTQHARMIAVYERNLAAAEPGCTYLDVCGAEWAPAYRVTLELMRRLPPACARGALIPYHHGMVTLGGAKLGSSEGDPELLDDVLDWFAASPELAALVAETGGTESPDSLAATVLKGFFALRRTGTTLAFSRQALTDRLKNPALDVARARSLRSRAGRPARAQSIDPADPLARLVALRSQALRGTVERAVETLDFTGLAAFAVGYARLALACESAAPFAGGVLDAALPTIGLARTA